MPYGHKSWSFKLCLTPVIVPWPKYQFCCYKWWQNDLFDWIIDESLAQVSWFLFWSLYTSKKWTEDVLALAFYSYAWNRQTFLYSLGIISSHSFSFFLSLRHSYATTITIPSSTYKVYDFNMYIMIITRSK